MASKTTRDCLLEAVEALRVKGADPEELASIKRQMRNYIKRSEQDDVQLVSSLQHMANSAYHRLVADRIAQKSYERNLQIYNEGRFNTEGAETLEAKVETAAQLRREVSAEWGNRGSTEETTLESAMAFEQSIMSGKLSPIVRFINDSRLLIKDSEMARVWFKEVIGIDTGNAEAKEMAKLFHDVLAGYLTRLKDAGVLVEKIPNWFPQTHDWAKIQGDFDKWKQFMLDNLDRKRHPDAEVAVEALQSAVSKQEFDTAVSGRLGMGRTFWFKTPEAQFQYQLEFGRGNIVSTLLSTIHRVSSEVALAEKFGAKPLKMIEERTEQMAKEISRMPARTRAERRMKNKANRQLDRAKSRIKFQQSQMSAPTTRSLENILLGMRETASALYLGKVTGSIVTEDAWNGLWQGRYSSGGFMAGVGERMRAFADVVGDVGNAREIAEGMGWYQHGVLANGAVSRYSVEIGPENLDIKAGSWDERFAAGAQQGRIITNRITVASILEQGYRGTNGVAIQRGIQKLARYTWNDLDPKVKKIMLESNGITARDWESIRSVARNGDEAFDLQRLEIQNPKLFRKVGAMITREAHIQTIYPDLESRFLITGLIPPGVPREAVTIMTQFLAWPMAAFRNAVVRDMRAGVPDFLIGASGYVFMTAMKLQLYALAAGGIANTFEWNSGTLWRRALLSSAVAGPWLPMIVEGIEKGEVELPGIVPNRIIGTLNDGISIGNQALIEGETDKAMADAAKVFGEFVPNWWFIDGATNHIIESIVEDLDPQTARRTERRREREGRRGE